MFVRDIPVGSLFFQVENKDILFVLGLKQIPEGISMTSLYKTKNNTSISTRIYLLESIVGDAWTLVANE